jgi:hypothetical protein
MFNENFCTGILKKFFEFIKFFFGFVKIFLGNFWGVKGLGFISESLSKSKLLG